MNSFDLIKTVCIHWTRLTIIGEFWFVWMTAIILNRRSKLNRNLLSVLFKYYFQSVLNTPINVTHLPIHIFNFILNVNLVCKNKWYKHMNICLAHVRFIACYKYKYLMLVAVNVQGPLGNYYYNIFIHTFYFTIKW